MLFCLMKHSVTVKNSIKNDAAVMQEEVMTNEGIDISRFFGVR